MTFKRGDAKSRQGYARMKAIGAENEVEIRTVAAGLLASLDREPTMADAVQAETIACNLIRSRRLRAHGRDDQLERQQLAVLLRDFRSAEPRQERPVEHGEHAVA
jgi:hypothetical protein